MSDRRILAPHKEQNGWVYVRVPSRVVCERGRAPRMGCDPLGVFMVKAAFGGGAFIRYPDDVPNSRTISSRRVEEAVETADYLKRCAEEMLEASYCGGSKRWTVRAASVNVIQIRHGDTLREAYWRYKNAVAR